MAASTNGQGTSIGDASPSVRSDGEPLVDAHKTGDEREAMGEAKVASVPASSVQEGFDRLLHRHRSEIMFELRRLQMNDRPVTGQGNREAVEELFNQTAPSADGSSSNTHHRPEAIIVEVNALVERRRVSSMLQSDLFRRNLETMVRGTLGRFVPLAATHTRTSTVTRQQSTDASASETETVPIVQHEDTTVPRQDDEPVATRTQPQQVESHSLPEEEHTHAHRETILQAAREARLPEATATFAQAWLQQFDTRADGTSMWERLQEADRDSLVAEISDLVQRQLVTSTLQSERRDRLERNLRRHVADSGIDGRRAQEALRSLPPASSSHRRNDFTHLGIGASVLAGSSSDELDAISLVSATAAVTVPYEQSNRALRHEMQQLRGQVKSLQTTVQLTFDLQLEIQRAIRQEVSAGLARGPLGTAVANTADRPHLDGHDTSGVPLSRVVRDGRCLVCLDRSVDTVFYQCGHMCVCYPCAMELRARDSNCLMCRAPIRDAIRVYTASVAD